MIYNNNNTRFLFIYLLNKFLNVQKKSRVLKVVKQKQALLKKF